MLRCTAFLLLCCAPLFEAPLAAGQETVRLEGRLIHAEGRETGRVELSFGPFGATVTRADGFFTHRFPAATGEATLEVLEEGWTVLFPRNGRVAIPASEDVIVEVVVGDPIEEVITRSLAEKHQRLLAELTGLGAEQEQIRTVLESFLEEVRQRIDVDEAELERAIDSASERRRHFPEIAEALRNYVLTSRDMLDHFTLLVEHATKNPAFISQLDSTVLAYNDAFSTIHNERAGFEQAVAAYWQDERLTAEFQALMDYAEGEVHRAHMLRLNESIVALHELAARARRDGDAVAQDIRRILGELGPRVGELDRRTERMLQALFTE